MYKIKWNWKQQQPQKWSKKQKANRSTFDCSIYMRVCVCVHVQYKWSQACASQVASSFIKCASGWIKYLSKKWCQFLESSIGKCSRWAHPSIVISPKIPRHLHQMCNLARSRSVLSFLSWKLGKLICNFQWIYWTFNSFSFRTFHLNVMMCARTLSCNHQKQFQ